MAWVSPANMLSIPPLDGQWAAVDGFEPILRVDRWPVVLVALGTALIVFELTFVFLAFSRWRWVAVLAGVTFHLTALALVNIGFTSLVVCYVAFVPWAASTREPGRVLNRPLSRRRSSSEARSQ